MSKFELDRSPVQDSNIILWVNEVQFKDEKLNHKLFYTSEKIQFSCSR